MLIHKVCRRRARPALLCSLLCHRLCVCVCVCVCSAPIGAVCHAVICVLAGGHWGSADNPTFPLHARSSSESDRYRTVSHRCPGASKFTFGQRQTLRHTAVLERTKKKKKEKRPLLLSRQGDDTLLRIDTPGLAIAKQLNITLSKHI